MFLFLVVLLLFLVPVFFFYHWVWKRLGLPPGPTPHPLLGNVAQLDPRNPQKTIQAWGHKYGPVLTVWMGSEPFILVNDFQTMKKYFTGKTAENLSFRPRKFLSQQMRGGTFGLSSTDGAIWQEQRRFALHVLRDFGFGRNIMEDKIQARIQELLQAMEQLLGPETQKTLNIHSLLELCIGNVINSILFGRNFDDAGFAELKRLNNNLNAIAGSKNIKLVNEMPWLRFLPIRGGFSYWEFMEMAGQVSKHRGKEIAKNKAAFDPEQEPTDFVSAYLKEMHLRQKRGEVMGHFSEKQLAHSLWDMWSAGQEITLSTIRWGILYMLHYPEVQARAQAELAQYSGPVTMKAKSSLPYTYATVQEVQRLANLVPINVPHTVAQEMSMNGYKIQPGIAVVPQISAVLMDPTVFPEPEKMDPTRFLDDDGKVKKIDEFVPFSLGKRVCMGESLARMELFLIFAELLRNFKFECAPEDGLPEIKAKIGFLRHPEEFKVLIRKI